MHEKGNKIRINEDKQNKNETHALQIITYIWRIDIMCNML